MNWLRTLLLGGATAALPAEAPDEPPYRQDACPDCGCDDFTAGGPTVRHESNGSHSRVPALSAVLCCLGCGARWYGTPHGLKRPHEAALPPQWAIIDAQAKAQREQAQQQRAQVARQAANGPHPIPRGPGDGFRKPPKPR